jgi:hypothetical protein
MAPLTRDRDTPHKYKERKQVLKVAAETEIFAGALVAELDGYAVPAGDTAAHVVMGRAEEHVDNSDGAEGAKTIAVSRGVFRYVASSIVQADVGKNATVVDDQTVGLAGATTNDIVAGRIEEVDSVGVWIAVGIG